MPKGIFKNPIERAKKISLKLSGIKMSKSTRENMSKSAKSKIFSEQHRKKLSLALKGIKRTPEQIQHYKDKLFSEEHRKKISLSKKGKKRPEITGNKNNFWKGGITPENTKIRESIEYRIWREAVFSRDNFTCQDCKKIGGDLEAHHIKPFSLYPELRFAIDNGQTLCITCHRKTFKKTITQANLALRVV